MTAALPMSSATVAAQIEKLKQMHEQAAEAVRQAEQAVAAGWQDVAAGTDAKLRKQLSAAREQADAIAIALVAAEAERQAALDREDRAARQAKRAEMVAILRKRGECATELLRALDQTADAVAAVFNCSVQARNLYGKPASILTDKGLLVDEGLRELFPEVMQHWVNVEMAHRLPNLWRYERVPQGDPVPLDQVLADNAIRVQAEFDARFGTTGEP